MVSVSAFVAVALVRASPAPSSSGRNWTWNVAAISAGDDGTTSRKLAVPAALGARSTRSGLTCSVQPATPCGRSAGNDSDVVPSPSADSTTEAAGRPVPRASHAAPSHGRSVVRMFAPPLLGQPAPRSARAAGHVGAIVARYAEAAPSAK